MATTIPAPRFVTRRPDTIAARIVTTLIAVVNWATTTAGPPTIRAARRTRTAVLQVAALGIFVHTMWTQVNQLAGGLAATGALLLLEVALRPPGGDTP